MILSKHVQPSPSRTHVTSHPMNSEPAPCFSSPELVASPRRSHKPSFSKPMTWLNRSSSSTSIHSALHAAPKPIRISEPKVGSSLEQLGFHRSGPLGSGATIVRTPQEALSGSTRAFDPATASEECVVKQEISLHESEKVEDKLPPLPSSPPLPLLPDIADAEREGRSSGPGSPECVSLSDHALPPRSSTSPSPSGHSSPSRSTLVHIRAPSCSIPTLPADDDSIPPQPPFEAILLSPVPDGTVDPSKIIVTLETCSTTYRTSLRSLVSRPSHLSRYITSLLSSASKTASIYSTASDAWSAQHSNEFSSFFRDHLASSGCLLQSTGIHVFLDRPSAPYTHVLAYLRSLPSTQEYPETLPRAVHIVSTSPSRLEALFGLRDEARYLGLAELEKLCCHEIQRSQRTPVPTSVAAGMRCGQTGSIHSFHTVVERCQSRQGVPGPASALRGSKGSCESRTPVSATRESNSSLSVANKDVSVWERNRQGKGTKYEVGPPPPGWI